MKQELDQKSIEALTQYRIHRAKETLLEAETLINSGFFNAAVNRIYYACYYAVIEEIYPLAKDFINQISQLIDAKE